MKLLVLSSLLSSYVLARSVSNSYPGHEPAIETRTLDEQYAAAQRESGTLTVLWGGDAQSQSASTVAAFTARFPKIKLNLTVDVSKYHDSRVDRQYEISGEDGADVAFLQTLHDFDRWKRTGRLLPYKPPTWNSIYPIIKDPHGAYLAGFFFPFGNMIYDKTQLHESQVPTTFDKFLDPFWKGKLVLVYPNDDDAITYLFSLIIDRYGWEWFETLAARQNVIWVRGTGTPAANLAGFQHTTGALSFTTNLINAANLASKATTDPHMLWPQSGAIFATTKRPESAKLFMSWMLSDEHQTELAAGGSYIVRSDLNVSTPEVWTDESVAPTRFSTFMTNREVVERLKLQFETTLGPAQGPSPLTFPI
ncbi:hypothetical protein F5884DRAFT_810075 [Xylogone sp. PMI_703]|nr:hypothetical protein F5884DRAFT_810075 [Xylogone sp. PMI_703]